MSKAPPIPPEQRAFRGQKPDIAGHADKDGLQGEDRDVNVKQQGRHGALKQNIHHQQDR